MTAKQVIWAERVREWQESGKTLQEFAAGQPYKPLTLRWWASELRRRQQGGQERTKTAIKLAPVIRRPAAQSESRAMAVELSGARIVVERGFDAKLLAEIVDALGGGR